MIMLPQSFNVAKVLQPDEEMLVTHTGPSNLVKLRIHACGSKCNYMCQVSSEVKSRLVILTFPTIHERHAPVHS